MDPNQTVVPQNRPIALHSIALSLHSHGEPVLQEEIPFSLDPRPDSSWNAPRQLPTESAEHAETPDEVLTAESDILSSVFASNHHDSAFSIASQQDYGARLTAVEASIEQIVDTQVATVIVGVVLLGRFLAVLGGRYLSRKKSQGVADAKASDRKPTETPHTLDNTNLRSSEAVAKRRTNGRMRGGHQLSGDRVLVDTTGEAAAGEPTIATSAIPFPTENTELARLSREDSTAAIRDPLCDGPEVPEPTDMIQRVIRSINDLQPRHKLQIANDEWQVGFARHIGPTRESQEDYVIALRCGDFRVCLLADGAGGHPLGEWASYCGIVGAAASIAQTLAFRPAGRDLSLERAARQAMEDASFAIAIHAVANGIPQLDSMRSTLIVLLATDHEFAWANLGDGGGWTIQATPRSFNSFVVPAKGGQQNFLRSSLGPQIRGEIFSGTKPWDDADLLVIASDGVADVIDQEAFFNVCLATGLQKRGHLNDTAEAVLQMLAESPGVSDNLSIGFVGRGRRPVLAVDQLPRVMQESS
jgi:serine/threonine protein phosphatase PrpC